MPLWRANQAIKENNGYTLLYGTGSSRKKFICVEAVTFGSVTRFSSHSCDPNAAFVELQNQSDVKVLIKMIKSVKAGAEMLVHYGKETWFTCTCDECWTEEATTESHQ